MGNGSSAPIVFPERPPEQDLGVIGGYSLTRKLGKGSYGEVYECRRGDMTYAMKIQKYSSAQELDFIVREIEQLTKINHPNIIRYQTTFPWTLTEESGNVDVICIVTDIVVGASMETVLKKLSVSHQMVPPEIRAKWTVQLISTMAHLHALGKVHRDLKPANILVDAESLDLVIIDFGAARDLDESGYAYTIVGTPLYMAPELRNSFRQPYTDAVDVWSIGMILIEVLAGVNLDTQLMRQTEKAQWEGVLLKKLASAKVPQVLIEILVSMLRSEPTQRLRLRDLEASSLYRGYRLCYGLVPEEAIDDEVLFLTADATNFSSLLVAVENQPDEVVKWAISIAKANINNIPVEVFTNPKVVAVVSSLSQHHPEMKSLLSLIDKRKRRSRVNSGELPVPDLPPSSRKSNGWSIQSASLPGGTRAPGRTTRKTSFTPLTKASSTLLDQIWEKTRPTITPGAMYPERVEGVLVNLSAFEMTASDALDVGLVLVDFFSSQSPRAMVMATETWYSLSRRGPPPAPRGEVKLPTRRWSMHHIDEWIEIDPDYHEILTLAYHIEGVEGIVLKKKGKVTRIVNFRHSIVKAPRGNPSALRIE